MSTQWCHRAIASLKLHVPIVSMLHFCSRQQTDYPCPAGRVLGLVEMVLRSLVRAGPDFRLESNFSMTVSDFIWAGTVFTTQHVCIARIMPWQDVCSSVCLSVTCQYSVETVKKLNISSKLFHSQVARLF